MPQTKEETDTDIKGKQERNMENEIKSEIKKALLRMALFILEK